MLCGDFRLRQTISIREPAFIQLEPKLRLRWRRGDRRTLFPSDDEDDQEWTRQVLADGENGGRGAGIKDRLE